MAIRSVITRGFGNGTFNGTIGLVVTKGYAIGVAVVVITPEGRIYPIASENRIYPVDSEDRIYAIPIENRIYPVDES